MGKLYKFPLTILLKGLRFRSFNFQTKGQLNMAYIYYMFIKVFLLPWTSSQFTSLAPPPNSPPLLFN